MPESRERLAVPGILDAMAWLASVMRTLRSRTLRFAVFAAGLSLIAALVWDVYRERPYELASDPPTYPKIQAINPPENGFFTKELSYHGIAIKAPSVVVDDALYILYDRLARQTAHLPMVVSNLAAAGAEVHIIGRHQVTTDLPEWRKDKHIPLEEENGLTRDQRTRGMGGLMTSCGEENLLQLFFDRYRGRDICTHEFAHNIEYRGIPASVGAMFDNQFEVSKAKGLWINSYAGSNSGEYFAELTMWYFGTHGDRTMAGPKPKDGPEGLKAYDPDAYKLFDDFYSGRIEIAKVDPPLRSAESDEFSLPRDNLLARGIVAKLSAYKVGQTKLADFLSDAGITSPEGHGKNGWSVKETSLSRTLVRFRLGFGADYQFRVCFHNPPKVIRDRALADLEFKGGLLTAFAWDD
jgi:hypothetical protein